MDELLLVLGDFFSSASGTKWEFQTFWDSNMI